MYEYHLQSVIRKMLELDTPELFIPTAHGEAAAYLD